MRDPREVFGLTRYIARRKVFKLFGGSFTIHDPETLEVVACSAQKAFKLKEDIRVFADDLKTEEILLIRARSVIDFSAAYDVVDPANGEKVGALRRKGFASIFRDRWQILDEADQPRGEILEDSGGMAFVRRFLTNLIPQRYRVEYDGRSVGSIRQFFNPFVMKVDVDLGADPDAGLDRRLALAAVVLLLAIEGRQN